MRRRLSLAIGVCAVLLGAALTLKPFDSLDALTIYIAVSLLAAGAGELASGGSRLAGALLIVTGVLALALPGLTVSAVAVVVGVGMAVSGGVRLVAGVRGRSDERYASSVGGLAGLVVGILALAWPDVTVLVIALLVGPLAVIWGIAQIVRAVRDRPATERRPGRHRGWRVVRATASLLLAGLLVAVSAFLHRGSTPVDRFYTAPAALPDRPGQLLRSEPFTRGIPAGAKARRILYTTAGRDGRIEAASGVVVVPDSREPAPVILWAHGTTGVARQCAPSLLPDGFTAGALFVLDDVVRNGWALVAPDYPGLGTAGPHPYLVGRPTARSALDAARAARQLRGFALGEKTVAWGHSQGGGAALWIGEEARRYAPDVPLSGVAALAPASDVLSLGRGLQRTPAGMLFATFVVKGYSDTYPDVKFNDYVRASARGVVRRVVGRCLSEKTTLASLGAVLTGDPIYRRDLASGPLAARLKENVPATPTGIPTLVAQGLDDALVLPPAQRGFVKRLCANGQPVDYRTYSGRDHVALVAADSPLIPELLGWTRERLAGAAAPTRCTTHAR